MKDDQQRFLALLGNPPARLTAEQAAWFLNCQPHDMPALISSRLVKPLGNPAVNSVKFFSRDELVELAKDRAWLSKITVTINQHWQKANARKSKLPPPPFAEAA